MTYQTYHNNYPGVIVNMDTENTFTTQDTQWVDDKIRARKAKFSLMFSKYVWIAAGVLTISPVILWLFVPQYTQLVIYAGGALVAVLAGLGYPFLFHAGWARLGGYIMVLSLLLVIVTQVIVLPAIIPAMSVSFLAIIIVSYTILDDRDSRWVIGVTVLAFVVSLFVAKIWSPKIFSPLDETVNLIIGTLFGAFALLVVILIVRLILIGQDKQFYQSQLANLELQRANQEIERRMNSEREQREQLEQASLQITAQQDVIRELSTPVIPVAEGIIVLPLIGSVDSLHARDITRSLLTGITQHRAKLVILDVTGMPLVDTGIVNHLNKTIQAAQLKGAQTIVTGVSDAVAEAIVDLGIDWSNVVTLNDLQTGLGVALKELGFELGKI
ncbi:MAG: STAS domain-containing protein [Anaerolineae bacterium]|nr:STAS domain-containing protein [Anaerolineae bacterium]